MNKLFLPNMHIKPPASPREKLLSFGSTILSNKTKFNFKLFFMEINFESFKAEYFSLRKKLNWNLIKLGKYLRKVEQHIEWQIFKTIASYLQNIIFFIKRKSILDSPYPKILLIPHRNDWVSSFSQISNNITDAKKCDISKKSIAIVRAVAVCSRSRKTTAICELYK